MLGLALTLAAALPAVGLNHIYVVLDQATYEAVLGSDFVMDELAAVDSGLNHREKPQPSSPSVYLRGRDTYIELLGPRNRIGAAVGACGLVLSPDEPGALDKLERGLRRAGQPTHRRVATLDAGEHPIPWNEVLTVDAPDDDRFTWWVSQYHPEFVQEVLHTKSVDRRSFLTSFYRPERLLENVIAVTLALSAWEATPLGAQLRALGFRETRSAGAILLDGAGVQLRILPQHQASGPAIVSATLGLARPATRHLELGTVRIDADGRRAVWRFAPDPAAPPPH